MSRSNKHAHHLNRIEALERRLLWAATLAPTCVNGLVIGMTTTAASGDFDKSAPFNLSLSADDAGYTLTGGLNGHGNFTFARSSLTAALVRVTDAIEGTVYAASLSFSSRTAGTFSVTASGMSGGMSGTFSLTGTVRPLAVVSNGLLTVTGTVGDDTVSIVSSAGKIYVAQNNYTNPAFTASSVTSMNVFLREASDALVVGTGVGGFYCDAGPGNDNLVGGDGADTLTGGAGKDLIDGGLGDDRLNGSGSPDHLIGNAGGDRLYGGDGDDFCEGGGGVDRIWGGTGNDILAGGGSNDKMFGEAGNDSLYGGTGSDILDGGADTDLATSDGTDILTGIP